MVLAMVVAAVGSAQRRARGAEASAFTVLVVGAHIGVVNDIGLGFPSSLGLAIASAPGVAGNAGTCLAWGRRAWTRQRGGAGLGRDSAVTRGHELRVAGYAKFAPAR